VTSRARLVTTGLVAGVLAVSGTACSDRGDLGVTNEGPGDVTVMTGDQELTVDAGGGAAILDYGCTPGDVTVDFASGPDVVLPGPVCPDRRIVVGDGTATLLQQASAVGD
jgi:hypothetical protein